MITGEITANRETIIELEIIGSNQKRENVEAVADKGFNGYLTLPSDLINQMRAKYDFSKGERGKFYNPKVVFNLSIYLEKDVNNCIRKPDNKRYKLKLRRIRK